MRDVQHAADRGVDLGGLDGRALLELAEGGGLLLRRGARDGEERHRDEARR